MKAFHRHVSRMVFMQFSKSHVANSQLLYVLILLFSQSIQLTRSADFEPPNTSVEPSDYEDYCRRELPRVFRASLEELVHNDTQFIEDRLRSRLERMITQCQHRVFSNYRSGGVSRSQTPPCPMHADIQSQSSTYVVPLGRYFQSFWPCK